MTIPSEMISEPAFEASGCESYLICLILSQLLYFIHLYFDYFGKIRQKWVILRKYWQKNSKIITNSSFSSLVKEFQRNNLFSCICLSWCPVVSATNCVVQLMLMLSVILSITCIIVKLREREGQGVDLGRSLEGHLQMVDGGWWLSFPQSFTLKLVATRHPPPPERLI